MQGIPEVIRLRVCLELICCRPFFVVLTNEFPVDKNSFETQMTGGP